MQILTIKGTTCKLVSAAVQLELDAPGRAVFCFAGAEPHKGDTSRFFLTSGQESFLYCTMFVESISQLDQAQYRVVCRDYMAVLAKRLPFVLRNAQLTQVLKKLAELSGVAFATSGEEAFNRSYGHFVNTGSGLDAIDSVLLMLGAGEYIALPRSDGTIYIGLRSTLPGCKKPLLLPQKFWRDVSAQGATCTTIPKMRPGRQIIIANEIRTVSGVNVSGDNMRVTWQ